MLHGLLDKTGVSSRWSYIGLQPFTYTAFLHQTDVFADGNRFLIPPQAPALHVYSPAPPINLTRSGFQAAFTEEENESNVSAMMANLFPQQQQQQQQPPSLTVTQVVHDASDSTSRHTCAVCYEILDHLEQVLRLPCHHMFHEGCLVPWLEMDSTCPMCRTAVPPDIVIPL